MKNYAPEMDWRKVNISVNLQMQSGRILFNTELMSWLLGNFTSIPTEKMTMLIYMLHCIPCQTLQLLDALKKLSLSPENKVYDQKKCNM